MERRTAQSGWLAELRVISPLLPGTSAVRTVWDDRGFVDADAAAACVVPTALSSIVATLAVILSPTNWFTRRLPEQSGQGVQ